MPVRLVYGTDGSVTLPAAIASRVAPARDVLSLSGGGAFNLAGLDRFTGFEEVRVRSRPRPGCRTRSRCATGPT